MRFFKKRFQCVFVSDELNVISDINKDIQLNFDKKRKWNGKFTNFGESLNKIITSKTIKL